YPLQLRAFEPEVERDLFSAATVNASRKIQRRKSCDAFELHAITRAMAEAWHLVIRLLRFIAGCPERFYSPGEAKIRTAGRWLRSRCLLRDTSSMRAGLVIEG